MKTNLLIFFIYLISTTSYSQTVYREEFNGPFKSWANVKTRFKAAGNGIKDDTKSLQTALDSLTTMERLLFNNQSKTKYLVIYLPAGTYRISETLRLTGKIGVTFIGESPENTIIKWYGGDNDTMFFSNRSAYIKISRITWDGNKKANIEALGMHFKDFTEPSFAPTSVEFSDMIFKGNLRYGISAGTYTSDGTGMMDAEVAIKRCKFLSCEGAGILIKGFNALDYWIWDSEFTNCNTGVDCSHGNYHIYQSHFTNSRTADVAVKDALYSSIRGCYSNNSMAFSVDAGASCNAFKRIFQGNYVKGCRSVPIQYHHQGKISLMDNYFLNESNVPFSVDYASWCNANYDILSIDNSYARENPHSLRKDFPSKVHSIEDRQFNVKTMKLPAVMPLQPFVPYIKRKTFEVPVDAASAAIQKIIDAAAALKGQRAIVHFPMGNYNIDQTLNIPAGSDIQLIGDGILYASILKKGSKVTSGFYFFKIKGPSYITIKDIQIGQDGPRDKTTAFLFTNIDQPTSQVIIDQIYSKANNTIYIDQLNYTYFEKNNSFFSKGTVIIGGDKVKAGTGTSKLFCYGGQSAGVRLENNATMLARDCWWEGSLKKDFIPLNLSGNGNLTVDGALYAPSDQDSGTIINVSQFTGNLVLMNMYLAGSIDVKTNSPGLKMLIWNVNYYRKLDPFSFLPKKTTSRIAMMGITTQCFNTATSKCATEDPQSLSDMAVNVPNLNNFINELTKSNRKKMPKPFVNRTEGTSNIHITRVSVENGETACLFQK
ncbi:MAG: glycosyl hydrolase family 28-related protein [Chitinophagaceae bacterium]